MISLEQIEKDLTVAMKAKEQLAVEVLRGLKTRIQNEKTAKGRPQRSEGSLSAGDGKELSEVEIVALVRSEVKRRKEAAESFSSGSRSELAEKELAEAVILEKYLPAAMPEAELVAIIEKTITENNFTAKDFGAAMGKLKAILKDSVDGSTLAKILKEKLK